MESVSVAEELSFVADVFFDVLSSSGSGSTYESGSEVPSGVITRGSYPDGGGTIPGGPDMDSGNTIIGHPPPLLESSSPLSHTGSIVALWSEPVVVVTE